MDKSLRNTLRLAITQVRRLLEEALADRLAGELAIDRDGAVEAGFAFIDLCRHRYNVVLMNPPFGAAIKGWKVSCEMSRSLFTVTIRAKTDTGWPVADVDATRGSYGL